MKKAETRAMLLPAKESQQRPANPQKRGERPGDAPSGPSERTDPTNTLILDFSLQNHETIHFCCLSFPVCGAFLRQP